MFVDRNPNGEVCSRYGAAQYEGQEYLIDDHPDILAYLAAQNSSPNIGGFRTAMFINIGYNRIAAIVPPHLYAGLIGAASIQPTNYQMLCVAWNQMISSLADLDKPTTAEVVQWNTIAQTNNVPLTFEANGTIAIS